MILYGKFQWNQKFVCRHKKNPETNKFFVLISEESSEQMPSSKKQKSVEQGSSQDEKAIRKKYKEGQPFSFFLTQVKGIEDKYNSSFAFDISGKSQFQLYLLV